MQQQKDDFVVGELRHPNGHILGKSAVDAYNRYTKDINTAIRIGNIQAVEILKDNRHKFFQMCMYKRL